jgi:hypothetical protein
MRKPVKRSATKSNYRPFRILVLFTGIFLGLLLVHRFSPASEALAEVNSTWRLARASGGYTFSADIVQTTIPLPTIGNIGRSSKEYAYFVEGSTDFPNQAMEMALWSGGGSITDEESATRIKVAGDRAFAQRSDQTWEEISDFSGSFAPDGDFLGFLAAAKKVTMQGYEARDGVGLTRYSFELDGPAFAAFVRDALEKRLTEKILMCNALLSMLLKVGK